MTTPEQINEYKKDHSACPICGSQEVETTCMAMQFLPDLFDANHAVCGYCGWQGIVDDMSPLQ